MMAGKRKLIYVAHESEATTSGSAGVLPPGTSLGISDKQDVTSVPRRSSTGQTMLSPRREL